MSDRRKRRGKALEKARQGRIAAPVPVVEPAELGGLVRSEWRWILLVFALALALRLVYLGFLVANPLFDMPTMDPGIHDSWAASLAGEDSGGAFWQNEPYFRAPLYPYFLGILYKIAGTADRYLLVRIVQFIMGALSCALLFLIGRRLYDRRTGLIAGLIAAFYWIFIYFEGELLLPVLINFLNLLAVLMLIEALRTPRAWYFLASGLLFGLSAITRPNVLLFIPFATIWLWVLLHRSMPRRRAFNHGLTFLLGVVLCILPVTIRNARIGGDRVLIASQAGVNFYMGNNEQSDGRTAIIPGTRATWKGGYQDAINIAENERGRELKPSEVSAFWMGKGLTFLREQPGLACGLYWNKARALMDYVEHSNNQNIYFFRNYNGFVNWPIFISFWMLLPIGLAGILVNRRDRHWALFTGFFVIYLASFLPFFVSARYRVPVVPFLILLAAVFIADRVRNLRERCWTRLGATLGLALALLIVFQVNSSEVPDSDPKLPATGHLALGNAFYHHGEFSQATDHLAMLANFREPYHSRSLMLLGQINTHQGHHEQAAELFKQAIGLNPPLQKEVSALLNEQKELGVLALLLEDEADLDPRVRLEGFRQIADELVAEKKYAEAGPYYQKILELDETDLFACLNLGNILLLNLGMPEKAVELFRKGLEFHVGNEYLLSNLAGAYLKLDRLDEAEAIIRDELIKRSPQNARYQQMMRYTQTRRIEQAGKL